MTIAVTVTAVAVTQGVEELAAASVVLAAAEAAALVEAAAAAATVTPWLLISGTAAKSVVIPNAALKAKEAMLNSRRN